MGIKKAILPLMAGLILNSFCYASQPSKSEISAYKHLGFSKANAITLIKDKVSLEDAALYKKNGFHPTFLHDLINSNNSYNLNLDDIVDSPSERVYGDKMQYVNFFDFDENCNINPNSQKAKIPKDLSNYIMGYNPIRIENPEKFEKEVYNIASDLKYSKEQIGNAEPKEAIRLAAKIVASKMNPKEVDYNQEFEKQYGVDGINMSHDRLFEIGKGDCDKYAALTSAVFNIFKKSNQNLKNVYVFAEIGGNPRALSRHAWNSVLAVDSDKAYLSYIDTCFYDSTGVISASDDFHIGKGNDGKKVIKTVYEQLKSFR